MRISRKPTIHPNRHRTLAHENGHFSFLSFIHVLYNGKPDWMGISGVISDQTGIEKRFIAGIES